MTNVSNDLVSQILLDKNFDIISITANDEHNTSFLIVHDLHPEEEIDVRLVSQQEEGDDAMELQFSGPDVYTDEEAKIVLNDVMQALIEIIEIAVEEMGSGSGSGSTSGSGSSSTSGSGS